MPRIVHAFLAVCVAAVVLAACKGGSGVNGSSALLRIVQGNPAIGAIDYQIDAGGNLYTGAAPPLVQPFQIVSAASHTILFFTSGTKNATTPAQCVTPSLLSGVHYTLVVVSTAVVSSGCIIFQEPSATNGTVVYHNATAVSALATSSPTLTVYPIFCQPAPAPSVGATPAPQIGCTSQTNPSGATVTSAVTAGGSGSGVLNGGNPVVVGVSYGSATSGAGIAFTAAPSATSSPFCYQQINDPTLYPVTVDPTDTSNFIPNGSNDETLAIFFTDGATQTGSNTCPIAISGSTAL
jgi:hypothetical protein